MNFTNQQAIVKIKTQKCVRIQYKFASAGCHSRIVRCGAFAKYTSCENLYAYGIRYIP